MSPPSIDGYESSTSDLLSEDELRSMTVSHLKLQLRLAGKKVSGNKSDLVLRLLGSDDGREDADGDGGGGNDNDSGGDYGDPPLPRATQTSWARGPLD